MSKLVPLICLAMVGGGIGFAWPVGGMACIGAGCAVVGVLVWFDMKAEK